jgi:hypothetical protein
MMDKREMLAARGLMPGATALTDAPEPSPDFITAEAAVACSEPARVEPTPDQIGAWHITIGGVRVDGERWINWANAEGSRRNIQAWLDAMRKVEK